MCLGEKTLQTVGELALLVVLREFHCDCIMQI
jgi:hypothetical protein